MRVTIKDVAKRAKVALGTVSRVINNYPDVDPALRERVERVIQELNFRPSARARSFVKDASPIISFILSNRDFLHPVHSRILQGVEEYCEEEGYFVLFSRFEYTPETPAAELQLPRVLQSHGIADCLILAGTNYETFVEAIESLDVPYVMLGNNYIGRNRKNRSDQVSCDDFAGAVEATRYLIQLGHRDIWYIGDTSLPWFETSWQGYCHAIRERSLEPRGYTIALSDNYFANGYACAELLIESKAPCTAIFAGSDDIAFGAWDLLKKKGLSVPENLSLIGRNDYEDAQYRVPPLTSVRVDCIELGRQLGKMAIEKLRSPSRRLPEVIIPESLIKRGTVRPISMLHDPTQTQTPAPSRSVAPTSR